MKPFVVDSSLLYFLRVKYFLLTMCSIFAAFSHLPTFTQIGGAELNLAWSFCLFICSIGAMITSFRPKRERWEFAFTSVTIALIFGYAGGTFWAGLQGRENAWFSTTLIVALSVLPIWRVIYLTRKPHQSRG